MSPAPSAWRRIWGRATPSSPCSATAGPATRPSCSTRPSSGPRTCRCRTGWTDSGIRRMNDVIAMKGGGYYSLATIGAKHVIDGAAPLLLGAIARMPDAPGPFVFTDMGTADGGTSRDLIARMIEEVRRRWPGRQVPLVYDDHPRHHSNRL